MELNYAAILITFGVVLVIVLIVVLLIRNILRSRRLKDKISEYESKYSGIIDLDKEIEIRSKEFEESKSGFQNQIESIKESLAKLKEKYQTASNVYEELNHQINLFKDDLEIAEFGIYEPHFDFETSEIFKDEIKEVKSEQKDMIREKDAIWGLESWTVNGSEREGRKMIDKQTKLMLRAFNGECDSFISNVRWNNVNRMQERIEKLVVAINRMGETQSLEIRRKYVDLKLKELRLTHEYELKKYEEKEEQRKIKEQMREEEKARRDFEKAQQEAQKEEKMLQTAMKKAQEEIAKASEEERAMYESQLAELQSQLMEAQEKNQRAISMAQQTKSGHVYIISNIGSFGENVYKIGMTRRLEPLDRVKELGDASVPFRFDVHAMIYSEDAPDLENKLHKAFNRRRLNYVNLRREYFDISLEEIENLVKENHGEIEFVQVPEAKEYRESQIIMNRMKESEKEEVPEMPFPTTEDLFSDN